VLQTYTVEFVYYKPGIALFLLPDTPLGQGALREWLQPRNWTGHQRFSERLWPDSPAQAQPGERVRRCQGKQGCRVPSAHGKESRGCSDGLWRLRKYWRCQQEALATGAGGEVL